MADSETEAEWAKSKRIEEERKKAAQALLEEKPSKANLAYLDPKQQKRGGFSKDPDATLDSAEKFSEKSMMLVMLGVPLCVIGMLGSVVSQGSSSGTGIAIMSGILMGVGGIGVAIAVFLAIVSLVVVLIWGRRSKRKISNALWPAITTIVVSIIFGVVITLITR